MKWRRGALWWGGAALVCAGLNAAARLAPSFAEWYAAHIYPLIVGSYGRICSLFPFSVSEMLLYMTAAALIAGVALIIMKRLEPLRAATILVRAAIVIFAMFTLNCGINYHRLTFSERAGFEIVESTKDELVALCEYLVAEMNEAAEEIATDADGLFIWEGDLEEEAILAMTAAGEEYEELSGYYPRAKAVKSTWLMSYQQLQGIYSPFTVEANYNGAMPDVDKPSSVCHELSHLKGFMREDEANFIAYLACHASDSAAFRYSGAMLAFIHSGNALYKQDAAAYREVRAALCDQAQADLANHNAYWNSYEGAVSDAADKVNDTYLKANAQDDGTESYGRMVDLLLAWMREQ